MSHINLNELDLSKVNIAKSGRNVKLIYDKLPLQLVTSKLYSPFGVRMNDNNYSPFKTCNIDCSLNQSNDPISIDYRVSLEALDNKIMELLKDSGHLFNLDNVNMDNVKGIYSPILRENKTYPKLIKISLPRDANGNFDFVLFDENKEKIFLDDSNISEVLSKGKIFKTIIECSKLWYYNGKFGSTWNLKQLRFCEKNQPVEKESSNNPDYTTDLFLD
jgi:hypothetical protein